MSGGGYKRILLKGLRVCLVAALLAISYFFVFSFFFDSDDQALLKNDNKELESEYLDLVERRNLLDSVIDNLFQRDRAIYRNLFSADPFSMTGLDSSSFILAFSDMSGNPSQMSDFSSALALIEQRYSNIMSSADTSGFRGRSVPSIAPIKGFKPSYVSAGVGNKLNPFFKKFVYHKGLDIVAAEFTDVLAAADGMVSSVKRAYHEEGNVIEINHGDYVTRYSHLGDILVRSGQRVSKGKVIARTGNTGVSFAPHLHYEITFRGETVDPVYYMFQGLTPKDFLETIITSANSMQSLD